MTKDNKLTDTVSITHKGVTLRSYIANNSKKPTLVFQISRDNENLSIGLTEPEIESFIWALIKRLKEMKLTEEQIRQEIERWPKL